MTAAGFRTERARAIAEASDTGAAAIRHFVADLPPLDEQTRERLRALLPPAPDDQATQAA